MDVSQETEKKDAARKDGKANQEEPLIISKPVVREFDFNLLKLQLVAESAQIFEQKQISQLKNIRIRLFNDKTKNSSTKIVAKSGEMKSESGIMRLWGKVQVDTSDNQTLRTEEIFLNQKKNTIYNETDVQVTAEDDEINASSLHYDISTGILVLEKPEAKIKL